MSQSESYKKLKAEYKQYQQNLANQMPWKKKAFTEENRWLVENYNNAKRYIDDEKNADGKIPTYTWQKEHDKLSAKLRELDGKYQALKSEVDQVSKFRVKVYDVLRKEQQMGQPTQKRSQAWTCRNSLCSFQGAIFQGLAKHRLMLPVGVLQFFDFFIG